MSFQPQVYLSVVGSSHDLNPKHEFEGKLTTKALFNVAQMLGDSLKALNIVLVNVELQVGSDSAINFADCM